MTPRSLLGWAAVGALSALSFIACSDDSDDITNTQPGNEAGTTGSSGTTGASGSNGEAGTNGGAGTSGGSTEEMVGGEITGAVTWTKDKTYILSSLTFVRSGATLTIEPGTVIKGKKSQTGSALIVEKGGKLIAKGTKDAPIVFTSGEATRAPGDFGGVMLNGNAKVNLPAARARQRASRTAPSTAAATTRIAAAS